MSQFGTGGQYGTSLYKYEFDKFYVQAGITWFFYNTF